MWRAPWLEIPGTRTTRDPPGPASLVSAGWTLDPRMTLEERAYETLRWSNMRTLIAARDEVVLKNLLADVDVAGKLRDAWIEGQAVAPITVPNSSAQEPESPPASTRVLLLGDTGDGSQAQYAVAHDLHARFSQPGLQFHTRGAAAILIESDIVYPAGSADEYPLKFSDAYAPLLAEDLPIYAVPGNHDWNDGSLTGFMRAFCMRTGQTPQAVRDARRGALKRLRARLLWHDAYSKGWPATGLPTPPNADQKGPYLALDVAGVRFIGIDTGYDGTIDHEQAEWLVRTVESHPQTPKILFSGSPLIVNGEGKPCHFRADLTGRCGVTGGVSQVAYATVDDVVRRQQNGFVAAMGGDVHNYQRYIAHLPASESEPQRDLPYVVCGGGGVFIGQTWWLDRIEKTEPANLREAETVLFPARGHSRIYFDAVRRRAVRHFSTFTVPLGLAAAGACLVVPQMWGDVVFAAVIAVLMLVVGKLKAAMVTAASGGGLALALAYLWHPATPTFTLGAALVAMALALNMSARPISRIGLWWPAVAIAVTGVMAALTCVPRPLELGGHHFGARSAAIALMAGTALLAARNTRACHDWRDNTVAVLGYAVIFLVALTFVHRAFPVGAAKLFDVCGFALVWAELIGAAIVLVVVLLVTNPTSFLRSPQKAFDDIAESLSEDGPAPTVKKRSWLVAQVAKRQKTASIYETFSDGRLDTKASRGKGEPVTETFLPLYRSFLEIEYREARVSTVEVPVWDFAFTAVGVTGEPTTDSGGTLDPLVVDAFQVRWTPAALEIRTQGRSDDPWK
jgi:hypothetical protein